MTDAETAQAIEALTHRLKIRDQALRDGEDYADAEVFAREFMTALLGRGWRATEAKVIPWWKVPTGAGSTPPADVLSGLRADLEAKAAAFRETETEPEAS